MPYKRVQKKISKFKFVNKLYKDHKISFKVDRTNPVKILGFSVQTSKTKIIKFSRNTATDNFEYREIEKNLKRVIAFKEAEIIGKEIIKAFHLKVFLNLPLKL